MKLFEPQTLIIILVIALLIFGPKQLPKLGAMFGKTARSMREGMDDMKEDVAATKKTVREIAEPVKPAAEDAAEVEDTEEVAEVEPTEDVAEPAAPKQA